MKSRRLMNTIKPAVMSLLAWILIWTQLIIVPDPGFAEQSHTDSHPATQIGDWQQMDGDPATGNPLVIIRTQGSLVQVMRRCLEMAQVMKALPAVDPEKVKLLHPGMP